MSDTPTTVDELYQTANHSSNLRVKAERAGAGDVIVVAGWSKARVGVALMRLHGEYDGAAKRPAMSDTELLLLRAQLKSLPAVLGQVVFVMGVMRIPNATQHAGPILGYWLNQNCGACHGRKFETIGNTPSLSAKRCKLCFGQGVGRIPRARDGKRVLGWLDECVEAGRSSLVRRLRDWH